mmetsp:Transcript_107432/g.334896  ORF Transcript_107432/g.334896 Transcript_107432/m.334896 type:complete len:210 (+) Transcript_107432:1696-2325(+)
MISKSELRAVASQATPLSGHDGAVDIAGEVRIEYGLEVENTSFVLARDLLKNDAKVIGVVSHSENIISLFRPLRFIPILVLHLVPLREALGPEGAAVAMAGAAEDGRVHRRVEPRVRLGTLAARGQVHHLLQTVVRREAGQARRCLPVRELDVRLQEGRGVQHRGLPLATPRSWIVIYRALSALPVADVALKADRPHDRGQGDPLSLRP